MKKWNIRYSPDKNESLDLPTITAALLHNRGIETKEAIEQFLHPHLADISLEKLGIKKNQITKALLCIENAQKENKTIIIYGDYDVDGVCASAILWETIYETYKKCVPYIPDRVEEGYGLSKAGIDNVLKKYPDTGLIITVDNGIAAHDAVTYAKEKGLIVLITDHHTKGEKNPDADAILHTTKVCGTGVAYALAREISSAKQDTASRDKGELSQDFNRHLELVALATIADCMPLQEENRTLVKFGMQALISTQRLGLDALLEEAKIEKATLDVYHIGFVIAPRLNAAGRLTSAMDSLRLICTVDSTRAKLLAKKLASTNSDRQTLTSDLFLHAKKSVLDGDLHKVLITSHDSYNQGVIGLIASKLTESYYRPSIVISVGTEGISKGSARSVKGVHIVELLKSVSDHLIQFGGHEMAAGFSIKTESIPLFSEAIQKHAEIHITDDHLIKIIDADMELPFSLVNHDLFMAIQQFSPFGQSNPEPTFVAKNVIVRDIRILGKEGKHIKFLLEQDGSFIDAIAFGFAEKFEGSIGDSIDILYTVTLNTWNGRSKVELRIRDLR
jgi:single-stranded-DNA-specific exonuclease